MATKSAKTGDPAAPHSPRPTIETPSSPTTKSDPPPTSVATGGIAFAAGGEARPAKSLSSVSLPWLIAEVDGMMTRVASRVVRRRTGRRMKDGSTVERGVTSPVRGSSGQHHFLVDKATFDEIDHHRSLVAAATIDEIEQRCEDLSVASTVDVDNTHPYLLKHADMYAQGGDAGSVDAPTFIGVKSSPTFEQAYQFKEGQTVLYTGSSGPKEAIIMKVLYDSYDNKRQPYYEIKLVETDEDEATDSDKVDQKTTEGDEHGDSLYKCVNFNTSPTPLFQSLYQGKWQDAEERLANNPEEATIWVARYAKSNTGLYDEENVRWKLLPLHLIIAKMGLLEAKSDKDDDEDNTIEEEKTLKVITDLLAAYPQATQCRDDQNMIPLHQCIRGNCSLSIIEKLLEVDPSSVYTTDARGRNAFILAEKVHGKRIHGQLTGSADTEKLAKYGDLMALLRDAVNRVASPEASEPKLVEQDETADELLQQLRLENLSLCRENAELHHRVDMNALVLKQLVEILQDYEEERSVENYKEIFGSKEDLAARRDEILRSISQGDSVEMVEGGEQTKEKKSVGGDGAYYKRRERYLLSTPTGNKGNINIMSPSSGLTVATEPATPLSFDEEYLAIYAGAVKLATAFEISGDEPKVQAKEIVVPSESTVTHTTNMEEQNIFRPPCVIASSESPAMLPGLSWEEEELLQVE